MEIEPATAQDHRRAVTLTWSDVDNLRRAKWPSGSYPCYGIPRGGSALAAMSDWPVDAPEDAHIIIDDIVDSGRTRDRWRALFPDKQFLALIDKTDPTDPYHAAGWITFPWNPVQILHAEDTVTRLLQLIGDDPRREGLLDTPARVVRSWSELFAGYKQRPADILRADFDSDGYDQMIVCRDVQFYSTCEHHVLPFFGRAHVGYLPEKKVVGLSKLARLVEVFARRLQIQERLTEQIADALMQALKPRGVGVVVEAQHFCMMCRGIQKQQSAMITSSLKGTFLEAAVRTEFFNLVRP